MRRSLWPTTLHGQLGLIASVALLIPLCLISLFLRQNAVDAYTQISTRAGEMSMREASSALKNAFSAIVTTADKVATDERVVSVLKKAASDYPADERIDDIRTLRTLITSYEGESAGQVVRLVFVHEQQWLSNNRFVSLSLAEFKAALAGEALPLTADGMPQSPLWLGHNRLMAPGGLYYQEGISYVRIIRDMQNFDRILGYVMVYQPYLGYQELLAHADITGESLFSLTDRRGQVVAMGGGEDDGQALWTRYIEDAAQDAIQVLTTPITPSGWTLTMLLPQTGYGRSVAQLTWRTALLSLALGIAGMLLASALYRRIHKRINRLVASMKQVQQGDLSIRVPVARQDELGWIEHHFNHMLDQLVRMNEQTRAMEAQDRLMRIRLLRSQINPHFLYNMLNSILWVALDYGADRVCRMIKALSAFYKIALQPGSDEATIGHELLHVQRYVALQALRGEMEIDMQVDAEDTLRDQMIPNMLLQPLVENCFVHGFVGLDAGHIRLTVYADTEGRIQIAVEDDGVGMTEEQITAALENPLPSHAYGLYSILERLRLRYGADASMRIDSPAGRGCRIEIRIPLSRYQLADKGTGAG